MQIAFGRVRRKTSPAEVERFRGCCPLRYLHILIVRYGFQLFCLES